MSRFARDLRTLSLADVPLVGGKNAALGELTRALVPLGVPVPEGFAVTAEAYRHVLEAAGLERPLRTLLAGLDPADVRDLARRGASARELVLDAPLPPDLQAELVAAYRALVATCGPEASFAVRSSATAEDLPDASFAGQHDSFLHVQGEEAFLAAYRRCLASLFTDRAIHYRLDRGFDHLAVALSVGVMRMVRSDLAASGVMFSLDPESGFPDIVLVTGAYGLGDNVVQGAVVPDEHMVFKPTFLAGHRAVLSRRLGSKAQRLVYAEGGGTRNVETSPAERAASCLTDEEVLTLAGHAIAIERHFGRPMDMEWAKDGLDGRLYLIQARPETVVSRRPAGEVEAFEVAPGGTLVASGHAVGERVAAGPARRVLGLADLARVQPGDVLVADATMPDWEPVMKTAAAIVTQRGGRTCHAAIIARELGIPAVVGVAGALEAIADGERVTVSCAEGEAGKVYRGDVRFWRREAARRDAERPATPMQVILGNPGLAFKTALWPNDGVALARMEFIIAEAIRVHPMALVHPERVADAAAREAIAGLTRGYARPSDYFVEKLAEGIGTIAAAFYPRPVTVRMSDFKTNEYARLLGGAGFEPAEENPMLGFRGAARYTHPAYAEGFALECAAIRHVRGVLGLANVRIMIPFCRRVEEARRVLDRLAECGLARGQDGLEVYMMCEIPNNVIQLEAFAACFDGFSIGSNDLTQLVLGVDRDSALLADAFDERDPGVMALIEQATRGCKRLGKPIGICGQAPSDHPDFARQLVAWGIDGIGVNPDALMRTSAAVLEAERALR